VKTLEEVRKALVCCISPDFTCPDCPYFYDSWGGVCLEKLHRDLLVYILRLEHGGGNR